MNDTQNETIERIRSIHENIVVTLGVLIGIVLLMYFFTYAMLTDKGNTAVLMFEVITSIILVLLLIKLKHVAYWLMKTFFLKKEFKNMAEEAVFNKK